MSQAGLGTSDTMLLFTVHRKIGTKHQSYNTSDTLHFLSTSVECPFLIVAFSLERRPLPPIPTSQAIE
jgi:hypothetical protein